LAGVGAARREWSHTSGISALLHPRRHRGLGLFAVVLGLVMLAATASGFAGAIVGISVWAVATGTMMACASR